MDLVLGLSIGTTAIQWVLVEGASGEGDTIDSGTVDVATLDPDELSDPFPLADAGDRFHAVGITWASEAEATATAVMETLAARIGDNVIAVSEVEAAEALGSGIGSIAGYDNLVVCIVEADAAVLAVVSGGVTSVDRITRPQDDPEAAELASSVLDGLDSDDSPPDAVFVLGSADDIDAVVSALESATESPVISATEAHLALARGAALASAHAVNGLDAQLVRRPLTSRIGALSSVVAAAVLTLVVSVSVALGLRLTSDSDDRQEAANSAAGVTAEAAGTPAKVHAAPPSVPLEDAAQVVAKTIAVAAPPAPQAAPVAEPAAPAPAYVPPAPAYVPPAPAYVPPAPAYVPPAPPPAYVPPPNYVPPAPPQPRLRDRIIERIPIINRFHEPEYQYPQ
jgi:hypothetical protein